MNYAQIKKLDESTLKKLTDGIGPSDECLCTLLSPPDEVRKGIRASIKKAFGAFGGASGKKRRGASLPGPGGQNSIEIPLTFSKEGKGLYTTKEVVKRKSSCGKCGCDDSHVVLKHTYANIRISTPDVSSICPCPSDCLPDKNKIANNIKVTVEQVKILDVDAVDSEFSFYETDDTPTIPEPKMERRSLTELLGEDQSYGSEWSAGRESVNTEKEKQLI